MTPPSQEKGMECNTSTAATNSQTGSRSFTANHSLLSSTSKNTAKNGPKSQRTSRAVTRGRVLFLVCLLLMAAALVTLVYLFMRDSESSLAKAQYEAIADRALDTAFEIANKKRLGTITMASVAGNSALPPDNWPFVSIAGYEDMATKLIETSNGREMGFAPIVHVSQLQEWEDFAYNYWETHGYPNTTGIKPFGKGIWGKNADGLYHVTNGSVPYESSNNDIVVPMLHHNAGSFPALLINFRFEQTRGQTIDRVLACCADNQAKTDATECGAITDILFLTSQAKETGPGALIMQPIYPQANRTVVGILASSIVWEEVLFNVFTSEVSGVDCVLESDTKVYTYSIENGTPIYKGEGDLHDVQQDEHLKDIKLTKPGAEMFSATSANYTLKVYPTKEFFDTYRTTNPQVAAIVSVVCILVTSLMFIIYDFYVRREFHSKIELLKAKRMFVRFVSHEVRTPLNSVCMGLSLLLEEIGSALGINALTCQTKTRVDLNEDSALEWRNLAEEILINAQSSVDVLNDLLNYDKVEMGTLSLELTTIPIWNLVEKTASEFKVPASAKNVDLKLSFDTGKEMDDPERGDSWGQWSQHLDKSIKSCKVIGDNVRVTQVLRNLLSNALKFTKDGGKMTVEAKLIQSGDDHGEPQKVLLKNGKEIEAPPCGIIQVSVTDTGAGMSKEQLAKLFRDGVQFNVNELQAGNGSGLGLFIAKGIVEQHGGTLKASSEGLGKGTTFTMKLPLFCIPDPEKPELKDRVESLDVSTGMSEHLIESTYQNVLIVDDAPTNRKLLGRLLKNHGHTIVEAEDGLDAVAKMEEAREVGRPFDTILLDYQMPNMNGPDACKEMRRLGCDAFVVGVTGNVMAEDVAIFKESGANGVLPKPFKLYELDQLWHEHGVLGSVTPISKDSEEEKPVKVGMVGDVTC